MGIKLEQLVNDSIRGCLMAGAALLELVVTELK